MSLMIWSGSACWNKVKHFWGEEFPDGSLLHILNKRGFEGGFLWQE